MLLYEILVHILHEKNIIIHAIPICLTYKLQHRIKNLNFWTDHMLYQIFKIISGITSRNMKQ